MLTEDREAAERAESIKEERALASWRVIANLLYLLLNIRQLMHPDGEKGAPWAGYFTGGTLFCLHKNPLMTVKLRAGIIELLVI